MSFNFKTSLSMMAMAASVLTMAACAKNSAGNSTSSTQTPAQTATPEVKAALVQTQCPEMVGTYKNVSGDEIAYAMASVVGGVSITSKQPNGEFTYIVDGQQHEMTGKGIAVKTTYTASCAAGELKIAMVEGTGEGESKTNLSFKFSEVGTLLITEESLKGVATTYVMTKVATPAAQAAAAPAEDAPEKSAQPAPSPETHNPVDQPAQVPPNPPSDSDPGQAPPLPSEPPMFF